jgi:hypothetical protein
MVTLASSAGAVPKATVNIETNMIPSSSTYWYTGAGPWPGFTKMPTDAKWQTKDLRSGNPGALGIWSPLQPINATAPGQFVTGVSFDFRYIIGYDNSNGCGDNQESFPQLEIYLVENYTDVPGAGTLVYTSPHLGGAFGFDSCTTAATTCYAPTTYVDVSSIDLAIAEGTGLYVRFQIINNKCNLQIPIKTDVGLSLTVSIGPIEPKVHPHAGLSIGTTLILVAVFAIAVPYLAIGMLYNKHRAGKEGIELFPHRDFWSGLPGLVVDGMRFSFGKFRVATGIVSMSSSYDNL